MMQREAIWLVRRMLNPKRLCLASASTLLLPPLRKPALALALALALMALRTLTPTMPCCPT